MTDDLIEVVALAIWAQWTEMQGMDADPAGWYNSSPLYKQPYLDAARAATLSAAPLMSETIEAQAAEIERLKCEVKKQRSLRDQASFNAGLEQAAVIAKEWGDDAALTIDDVDGLSAISLAAVKGNVAAAFAISTAIRAALGETE